MFSSLKNAIRPEMVKRADLVQPYRTSCGRSVHIIAALAVVIGRDLYLETQRSRGRPLKRTPAGEGFA